jgi:hypothetical protein
MLIAGAKKVVLKHFGPKKVPKKRNVVQCQCHENHEELSREKTSPVPV